MGRPLQLVRCDEAGRFHVGEEASKCLREVRGPLAVVAVCGRARQGKSFILNQIAQHGHLATAGQVTKDSNAPAEAPSNDGDEGENSGFAVAATHIPCTKVTWKAWVGFA